MKIGLKLKSCLPTAGFSLVEALVAMAIAGIAVGALTMGSLSLVDTSEAASYSLAANSLALQGYERVKAAHWDAVVYPNVDEAMMSNFPPARVVIDLPRAGTNVVYATNYTTISTMSTNPWLKLVRIDCVYPYARRGFLTNTLVAFRAPETGQQNYQESAAPATITPVTPTVTAPNNRSTYNYVEPEPNANNNTGSWSRNDGTSGGSYGGGNSGSYGNNNNNDSSRNSGGRSRGGSRR